MATLRAVFALASAHAVATGQPDPAFGGADELLPEWNHVRLWLDAEDIRATPPVSTPPRNTLHVCPLPPPGASGRNRDGEIINASPHD
eukprot:gene1434-2781_t